MRRVTRIRFDLLLIAAHHIETFEIVANNNFTYEGSTLDATGQAV